MDLAGPRIIFSLSPCFLLENLLFGLSGRRKLHIYELF